MTIPGFPRRNAGASLKPVVVGDAFTPPRGFPRRNAGASLKRLLDLAFVETYGCVSPAEMRGPH